jgi:nucleoid DNA-binding protein
LFINQASCIEKHDKNRRRGFGNFRLSRRLDRSTKDLSLSETLSINLGHFIYKGENKKLVKIRRFHGEFQII